MGACSKKKKKDEGLAYWFGLNFCKLMVIFNSVYEVAGAFNHASLSLKETSSCLIYSLSVTIIIIIIISSNLHCFLLL